MTAVQTKMKNSLNSGSGGGVYLSKPFYMGRKKTHKEKES